MKRITVIFLAIILLFAGIASAYADENGMILDYRTDYSNWMLYAAVHQQYRTTLSFAALLDTDQDEIELKSMAMPSSSIGHIIVIDTDMPYCNGRDRSDVFLNYENAYLPILQNYLNLIGNGEMVKFIVTSSGGSSLTESEWMNNNRAQDYVLNSVTLNTQHTGNDINSAIQTALEKAANYTPGEPMFKNVFVLVDADGSNDNGNLTSVPGAYPFFLVTMTQTGNSTVNKRTERISGSLTSYQALASGNNGIFIQLNHTNKDKIDCGNMTSRVSQVLGDIQYYQIDLQPVQPYIDYSVEQQRFYIAAHSSDGSFLVNSLEPVETAKLPPPPEPTAEPTPDPVLLPEDTPAPTPIVDREANDTYALKVINRLCDLYYLEERPNNFDDACRFALMEFCRNNGLEEKDTVDLEAYEVLFSSSAIPKATPTPEPTLPPTAVPPTPSPVPKAYIDSDSASTIYVIKQLQKLYYLDPNEVYQKFDTTCLGAFLEFCMDNGIAYDKDYVDDDAYEFLMRASTPKVTPTPVPVVTEKPQPTIPPEGYLLNQRDEEGAAFISTMQNTLSKLNLYQADYTPGMIDQSTLDAIREYCTQYGLSNTDTEGTVSQRIVYDILTVGETRTPYVRPDPSLSEKMISLLKTDVFMIGNFAVRTWMLLVLILILLFVTILVIIIMRSQNGDAEKPNERAERREERPDNRQQAPGGNAERNMPRYSTGESEGTRPVSRNGGGYEEGDSLRTIPQNASLRVTFDISGGAAPRSETHLITSNEFLIGRSPNCDLCTGAEDRTISSRHAVLTSRKGTLYIRDVSTYKATLVNGGKISEAEDEPTGDVTMPIGKRSSAGGSPNGYALHSGDEITLGERLTIKVRW